jgi:GNAT superfamily N-acetyltransferase
MLTDGYHALEAGKIASVVTYLEMTARPAWIDGEFSGSLELMAGGDLEAYRAMFRRVGENWLWFSRVKMSDVELRTRLGRPGYSVLVYGGGFVELDRVGDEVEISLFGLEDGARGQGRGRAMMALALRRAWTEGTRRVWLHTCTLDDPRALGFYRKMGFHPYARGIEIASDPRVEGYLPETAAPQIPLIRG